MKNQKENSKRFLEAFNRIEGKFRSLLKSDKGTPFVRLVNEAATRGVPGAKHYRDDLREFAELRNAIVHNKKKEIIAEPHIRACETLEKIAALLTDPPRAFNQFQRPVEMVSPSDSIGAALNITADKDFSQLPVNNNGTVVGLLTSNSVMRWLGKNVEEEIVSLKEVTVAEVLEFTEYKDNLAFLGREGTLLEVLDLFETHDSTGRRLEAVVITNDGKSSQKPLGIVTHWDLPEIQKKLSVR